MANSFEFMTHDGRVLLVPLDAVRLIRPLTDDDKARAQSSSKERRSVIDIVAPARLRIEFVDKSSKIARENLEDLRAKGIALVDMGAKRYVPAANIIAAEVFNKDDTEHLKDLNEECTLKRNFRSRVETKAGTVLSSSTPRQVMDFREKAFEAAKAWANRSRRPPNRINPLTGKVYTGDGVLPPLERGRHPQ